MGEKVDEKPAVSSHAQCSRGSAVDTRGIAQGYRFDKSQKTNALYQKLGLILIFFGIHCFERWRDLRQSTLLAEKRDDEIDR
jgi:hypothetical protein